MSTAQKQSLKPVIPPAFISEKLIHDKAIRAGSLTGHLIALENPINMANVNRVQCQAGLVYQQLHRTEVFNALNEAREALQQYRIPLMAAEHHQPTVREETSGGANEPVKLPGREAGKEAGKENEVREESVDLKIEAAALAVQRMRNQLLTKLRDLVQLDSEAVTLETEVRSLEMELEAKWQPQLTRVKQQHESLTALNKQASVVSGHKHAALLHEIHNEKLRTHNQVAAAFQSAVEISRGNAKSIVECCQAMRNVCSQIKQCKIQPV